MKVKNIKRQKIKIVILQYPKNTGSVLPIWNADHLPELGQ